MKLKIDRGQARSVQQRFFPYLVQLCDMRIRDTKNEQDLLIAKLVRSVLTDVQIKFDRKLIGFAERFTFKFTDSESIVLYKLLMLLPLDAKDVWLTQLRQYIIECLYR